ncbi:MAG: hypothetical protein AAGG01_06640 [Planctomycetota bacterium]
MGLEVITIGGPGVDVHSGALGDALSQGLALIQRRGPDSPFGDLLGWVVVFFVIVWPILRGLLDTARKQRTEFDKKQAEQERRAEASGVPRKRDARKTLEDLLEGRLETLETDAPKPPRTPQAQQRRKVKRASRASGEVSSSFGERPASESSAPEYKELVGDPFDDSKMGLDLVPDSDLKEVPTEDQIEAGVGSQEREPGDQVPDSLKRTAAATAHSDAEAAAKDPEAIFARLERPLSPWQRAFILKEVLGAPLASRKEPSLNDLLD